MESFIKKGQKNVRNESDGQSKDNNEEECGFSTKLTINIMQIAASIHSKYAVRIPRSLKPILTDRLLGGRGSALLHKQALQFLIGANQ